MPLYSDPRFPRSPSFPRLPRSPPRGRAILIIIVGIFLLSLGFVGVQCTLATPQRAHALTQAREYIQEMHPSWTDPRITCQGIDTDSNGYVSCTIGSGEGPPEAIECASYLVFSFNRGCRPVRFSLPLQR